MKRRRKILFLNISKILELLETCTGWMFALLSATFVCSFFVSTNI